ncbi:uncharacterized protein LOC110117389 [Athalia rosae]|uniref:uncharacterized protein LOC110117389 n=1 Tax=Athalia rosae TaxID=37344 RepID=UPI002033A061|nr:uncharacterized protein LOC110117389 [Athalia rosae]XP_048511599.1 uncharacterized protein LOC110117389 [Athalia rosae]
MTFKSLLNFGSFGGSSTPSVDRYHSGSGDYGHYEHGWSHGGHKGKGSSGGAALSALTLLAFLFLINVMQQSLDNNNATVSTVLFRDGEQTLSTSARGDEAPTKIITDDSMSASKYVPIKTSLQIVPSKTR